MAVRTSNSVGWRRALVGVVASGALAGGLLTGLGSAPAWAEPTTEATAPDDASAPEMTVDQALAIIASDYDTGAGGGQVSTLIHKIMKLRQAGYYPSKGNKQAIVAALDKRPNQAPLVAALESTFAFQSQQAARAQQSGPVLNPPTIGINQYQPGQVPDPNSGGGINIPLNP